MKTDEYKKIIMFAVDNEIEAYEFYKAVADKTKDGGLKKIFTELAQEEAGHRKLLEGLASGKGQMHFDESKDYKVARMNRRPWKCTRKWPDAAPMPSRKRCSSRWRIWNRGTKSNWKTPLPTWRFRKPGKFD
jgi:hypothetical protein